jgi:hypothetical protein
MTDSTNRFWRLAVVLLFATWGGTAINLWLGYVPTNRLIASAMVDPPMYILCAYFGWYMRGYANV